MRTFVKYSCLPIFYFFLFILPTKSISQNCFDADFESGTLGGYVAYHGSIGNNGVVIFPNQGANNQQHQIMQVSDGYDPIAEQFCTENQRLLVTGSGTGKYTLRLGDVETGARTSKVVLSLDVTDDVSFFLLKYAIVINDPGHHHSVQPRFELNIKDEDGNLLDCGKYEVRAAENLEGFESCEDWRVRPWTTAGFELASYIGQKILIEIVSTDCGKGGHGGYAYIDATCSPLELDLESYCPGSGFARYVVTEGFDEYEWNTGEKTRFLNITDPVPGTEYQVTVTSSTGCTLVLKDKLPTLPSMADLEASYFDAPDTLNVCFGEEISYRPTGTNIDEVFSIELGYTAEEFYIFADESQTIQFVTSDNLGCAYDTTQLHLIVELLDLEFDIKSSCDGEANGELLIENIGDPTIETSLGTSGFQNTFHYDNLSPGEYTLFIKDANNCEIKKKFTILSMDTPEIDNIYVHPATCGLDNGSIQLATSDTEYEFSLNESSYSPIPVWSDLAGGVYEIKIRVEDGGCIQKELLHVDAYGIPELLTLVADSTYCGLDNGKIALETIGGYHPLSYSINGSSYADSSAYENLKAGEYQIIVEDFSDCRDTSLITISKAPYIQIADVNTAPTTCDEDNGIIAITVNDTSIPITAYLDSIEIESLVLEEVESGLHQISLIDHNGCEDHHFPMVESIPSPIIDSISYLKQECGNDDLHVMVHARAYNDSLLYSLNHRFFSEENLFTIYPKDNLFTVQDDTGCEIDTLVDVYSDKRLWMANIFSPNDDGDNDLFCCPDFDDKIEIVQEFLIYDRWGNKVYAYENAPWYENEVCWDGRFNNNLVENGVYVYYIKLLLSDGRIICKYGDVTVLR